MVPVKTMKEYDIMQEVIVLFSETTQRYVKFDNINLSLPRAFKKKKVWMIPGPPASLAIIPMLENFTD